jgi:hypothetical protein
MTTFAAPMVHDELDGIVSALCSRFPGHARSDIEDVVAQVYAELAANATVTTHLIPLTLNRSRCLLAPRSGAAVELSVRSAAQSTGSAMNEGG